MGRSSKKFPSRLRKKNKRATKMKLIRLSKQSNLMHTPTAPQVTNNTLQLLCRTCLKNCVTHYDIFNHKKDNILVADMLVNCTSLEIQNENGFPVNICNNCMEKLSSAFDFKTMVIESNTKLNDLRQCIEVKKERQLRNDDVECIFINEEPSIKIEQTTITDVGCKNEDTLGNQSNKEGIHVEVKLEFEPLEENVDFVEVGPCSDDSSKTASYEKVKQTIPVADLLCESEALGNEAGKAGMDTKTRLELESLDENSDDSEDRSKMKIYEKKVRTAAAAKQGRTQTYYDEKNAEVLNNPDYKRIISSGISKEQRRCETVYCAACNKTCSYKHYIQVHAYIHTGKVLFKCDQCEKRYSRKYMLKDHMRFSHSQTRDFACDECGKTYLRKQHLKSHKAGMHSKERPYKCKVCDKTFKRSSHVVQHCLVHMEDEKFFPAENKNFVCSTCGDAFARKKSLRLHLKMHRSDNSYICNYCGKHCLTIGKLKLHTMIHTGAKPFGCEICGSRFNRRCNVQRHMRVHAGETPYQCNLCLSSFKYRTSLGKHMKVHQKEQKCSDDSVLVKDC